MLNMLRAPPQSCCRWVALGGVHTLRGESRAQTSGAHAFLRICPQVDYGLTLRIGTAIVVGGLLTRVGSSLFDSVSRSFYCAPTARGSRHDFTSTGSCGHDFCKHCIEEWKTSRQLVGHAVKCPICRAVLLPSADQSFGKRSRFLDLRACLEGRLC